LTLTFLELAFTFKPWPWPF